MNQGEERDPAVYAMPAGVSFVDALAERLLSETRGDPLTLARFLILLPTRRSVRSLTEAFLRRTEGRPLLLPRMRPLGDLDAEELVMTAPEEAADAFGGEVPPAIAPMRRQVLLARAIMKGPHPPDRFEQALSLARELGRFLDQVQMEGLSLRGLDGLVPEDYAAHWQETLRFLTILGEVWPAMRETDGGIDPAERRLKLIEAQAARWRAAPPDFPVIAAGSTGSLKPVAELLAVIARLPQGRLVLPGLDRGAEPALWAAVREDPAHPQHGLANLLDKLGCAPAEVPEWPIGGAEPPPGRHGLLMAALRPAAVADLTQLGQDAARQFIPALSGLRRLDCENAEAEARAIALIMREALERPGKTAALVTPDRALARRVAAELRRWEVEVDDSAGLPLLQTPPGLFFRLLAAALAERFAPVPLLALLKHPFTALGMAPARCRKLVRVLERQALRGPRPGPGLDKLAAALAAAPDARAEEVLRRLSDAIAPFVRASAPEAADFTTLLESHIAAAEALARSDRDSGADRLWAGEAGEALAAAVADIAEAVRGTEPIPPSDYAGALEAMLQGVAVRPRYGRHPRLFIWGPLEARLQRADLTILGGLNESTWPAEPAPDPWLSRPMRARFGLPPPERRIGLSAHDFVQGASATEVVLTRALRVEGAPTVPARWLLRLDALLTALGLDGALARPPGAEVWGATLDRPLRYAPMPPPAPRPPIAARPRKLSVTQIGKWMCDPYAIYARSILKLDPLDPLDQPVGPADRGTLVHEILDRFVAAHKEALPEDAEERLLALARETMRTASAKHPAAWAFWGARLERIARWFIAEEHRRRESATPQATEVKGLLVIDAPGGAFTLTGTADRIDRLRDGALAIIDYKTGYAPKAKEVTQGISPQLALEAAIAAAGGFAGLPPAQAGELAYWRVTGARKPGEIVLIALGAEAAEMGRAAAEGLAQLVALFDDPATPYEAVPWPHRAPKFSDYRHLARVAEWAEGPVAP